MNARALLLVLLLTLGGAAAQASTPATMCAQPQGALDWWNAQASRVAGAPAEVVALHAAVLPRLQADSIAARSETCDYLDSLLHALEAQEEAGAPYVHAAAAFADQLRDEDVVVRPSLLATAEETGRRLESRATNLPATQDRMRVLALAREMYARVGLDGERLRASLWHDAEEASWNADVARMGSDLAAAAALRAKARAPLLNALYVAQLPVAAKRLEADERVMASHGASANVARLQEEQAAIAREQPAAVALALGTTAATLFAAVALVALFRIPARRLQEDVRETEVALLGVPR